MIWTAKDISAVWDDFRDKVIPDTAKYEPWSPSGIKEVETGTLPYQLQQLTEKATHILEANKCLLVASTLEYKGHSKWVRIRVIPCDCKVKSIKILSHDDRLYIEEVDDTRTPSYMVSKWYHLKIDDFARELRELIEANYAPNATYQYV